MTDEFRELSNRLAQGMNRDDCFAVLISGQDNEKDIDVAVYATPRETVLGLVGACIGVFNSVDDETAEGFAKALKKIVIEYEERRFQKGETE